MSFRPFKAPNQNGAAPTVKFATPEPKQDLLTRAGNFVQEHNLPGAKLGEALGTSFAAIGQLAKGNKEGFKNIIDTQVSPGKVAGDVARSASLPASFAVAAPTTVLGATAQGAGFGALTGGATSLSQGNAPSTVVKDTLTGGAIGGAFGGLAGILGKVLQKTGDKITNSVIKPSQADIKDGFSIDTIKKYNLGGSLPKILQKTEETMDDLTSQLNAKLAATDAKINMGEIYQNTAKRLTGNKLSNFGSNSAMSGALQKLQNEVLAVSDDGLMSIPQAQVIKRASGHYGAWSFGSPDPEAKALEKVYNTFYNELKTAIEETSPAGVREINKQISDLIPVMNAVIRRIPIAERSNVLSLTDVITLVASTVDPKALGGFALNLASKSGTVGNLLSKAGPKIAGAAAPLGAITGTAAPALTPQETSANTTQKPSSQLSQELSSTSPNTNTPSPLSKKEVGEISEMAMSFGPVGAAGALRATAPKLVKIAANFVRKQPPYGLLKEMSKFLDAAASKKLDPDFEGTIIKELQNYGVPLPKDRAGVVKIIQSILDYTRYGMKK